MEALRVWQRKILRKMLKSKQVDRMWVRRTNVELQESYGESNIIQKIKVQRLRWLGHLMRMPDTRLRKTLLIGHIGEGKKWRGQNKMDNDLSQMNVTG